MLNRAAFMVEDMYIKRRIDLEEMHKLEHQQIDPLSHYVGLWETISWRQKAVWEYYWFLEHLYDNPAALDRADWSDPYGHSFRFKYFLGPFRLLESETTLGQAPPAGSEAAKSYNTQMIGD